MKTKGASVTVGHCKVGPSSDYKDWSIKDQLGIDIKAIDGLGNEIEVGLRGGDIGYRIWVNGKEIARGGE